MTKRHSGPPSRPFQAIPPRSRDPAGGPRTDEPELGRALDRLDTRALRELADELGLDETADRVQLKRALRRRQLLRSWDALLGLDAPDVKEVLADRPRGPAPGASAPQRPTPRAPAPRGPAPFGAPPAGAPPAGAPPAFARRSAPRPAIPLAATGGAAPPTFVALDFETANPRRDSACAIAAVRVEAGRVVGRFASDLRPEGPVVRSWFHPRHTQIHGITAERVARAPTFRQVWPAISRLLAGASFLVAHNAPFDRSVLEATCRSAGLVPPRLPFVCTVQLSRRSFDLPSARLPVVCRHLRIPLDHHDALSDATAAAHIALAVWARAPAAFDVVMDRAR